MTPDIPGVDVIEVIGRGGFSIVYRAHQPRFDRTIAAKVFALDPADSQVVQAFIAEARNIGELAARADVVTVYETGVDTEGRPYLLLQYLPGGSLATRLKESGPLPVDDVFDVGFAVTGALVAAHSAGILHCDLKPANVLFDSDGRPVLADFGIARAMAAADSSRSMAFLTPHHAAPELWEGRPPDVSTDLYALGSMLYQLLSGRPPFQGSDTRRLPPLQIMRRVLADPVPPIARPDVPDGLAELIVSLLAKSPADRPGSAAEVLSELRALRSGEDDQTRRRVLTTDGTESPSPASFTRLRSIEDVSPDQSLVDQPTTGESPTPADPELVMPGRRQVRPVVLILSGVIALLVVALLLVVVLGDHREVPTPTTAKQSADAPDPTRLSDPAPAPELYLSGEAQLDGQVRILGGSMQGPKPWFASLAVHQYQDGGQADQPALGIAVIGGDSQNRIEVDGSGDKVRIFVSQMNPTDGSRGTVPLPSDIQLCFRTMPIRADLDATMACDEAT